MSNLSRLRPNWRHIRVELVEHKTGSSFPVNITACRGNYWHCSPFTKIDSKIHQFDCLTQRHLSRAMFSQEPTWSSSSLIRPKVWASAFVTSQCVCGSPTRKGTTLAPFVNMNSCFFMNRVTIWRWREAKQGHWRWRMMSQLTVEAFLHSLLLLSSGHHQT